MAEYRPKARDEIARNMAAIRSTENRTERALRQLLHRKGFRFRKYSRDLPGKPDIAFPTERVAVFVDGDYWHGRILRERGEAALLVSIKNPNVDYWANKFRGNVARDAVTTAALERDGWKVLRYWESDAKRDLDGTAERVASLVLQRRGASISKKRGENSRRENTRRHKRP